MHVVCRWIGNSQPIAAKHYLQVTDEHFEKAVRLRVQQPAVLPRTGSQAGLAEEEQIPVLQGDASGCDHLRDGRIPPAGIEQTADSPRRVAKPKTGAAKSAAVGDELPPVTPHLVQVIEAWDSLPPDTRTAILAIVEAAQGR